MSTTTQEARPQPHVSIWIRLCAYAVPLCILPSAAWRLVDAAWPTIKGTEPCSNHTVLEAIYIPSLSVLSLGLGLLTIGLVRGWGEVIPRWVPLLGGRTVNPRATTAAAYTGVALLVAVIAWPALGGTAPRRELPAGCHQPGQDVLRWYAPLVLWPALLAIVTRSYQVRHRSDRHS